MGRSVGILVALLAASQPARAQTTGGIGDTCDARADCNEGLRCFKNRCVDREAFRSASRDPYSRDVTRPYVGMSFGAMVPVIWNNVGEGASFAVSVGALIAGHVQLQLEASPSTTVLTNLTQQALPLVDVVGTAGYLVPISDMVSWIIRGGVGGGIVYSTQGGVVAGLVEFRLDTLGVAIRTSRHLVVEFNASSLRLMFVPSSGFSNIFSNVMVTWVTTLAFNYLF